ncbi:MAG TPA: DUF3102 domain-containing protein [Urbifossiella sp.]|nr:DUF3102 domain-containing protein [Urbifossiella sp.]
MPGPAPLVPVFRHADVPVALRDELRTRAEQVRTLAYRTVCDYVRIGQALAEARRLLRRIDGGFRAWVAAECPFSREYAYKLMRVAESFGPFVRHDAPEVIAPEALVILSVAPPGAVAFAVEQARDGERISTAYAREIVAAHRPQPDPGRAQLKAHEEAMAPIRDAEKGDRQDAREADREAAAERDRAARAMEQLARLAAAGGVVTVSTVDDADDDADDDPAPFHVSAILPTGRRAETRRSLADAIAAVLEEEVNRRCHGPCKQVKPVGEFGENRHKTQGKCSRCKVCERERHRVRKLKKRAAAG